MDKPIRVLHVIGIMNRGGAETMIMNLYRHIDRSKVQFDFVENSSEPAIFDEEIISLGGRIYRCPHYNGKNHFTYVKWWNEFFQAHSKEYPIVHGQLGSTAAIYLAIAKKYGVYTIAHSHNTNANRSLQQVAYAVYSFPTRFVADHFFACSAEAARDRFGRKISENHQLCQVLKNAIDLQQFFISASNREYIRKKYAIDKDAFVIGHIGRFAEQKNHRFLIEVFEQIVRDFPNAVLLLVGDGELRSKIENMVFEHNLTQNVIFAGVQTNVQEFYQAMDVFAFPSLYEGLGIVLIEAQASGLPCCVSDSVSQEAILTKLIQQRPLRDGALARAKWILSRKNEPHLDTTAEIQQAGYDIRTTTLWLQHFYEDAAKKHG